MLYYSGEGDSYVNKNKLWKRLQLQTVKSRKYFLGWNIKDSDAEKLMKLFVD